MRLGSTRIFNPGDGTNVGGALDRLNQVIRGTRAPCRTITVWFEERDGSYVNILLADRDGRPLDPGGDIAAFSGRPNPEALARFLARSRS